MKSHLTALVVFFVFVTLLVLPASAQRVVPSDRVTTSVTIRQAATSDSERLGGLAVGESLPFVQDVPRWREVRFSPTQNGFVSKSWTRVEDEPAANAAAGLDARDQDELRVHFLPIGAGTCAVIECPGANAQPMIIDCGSLHAGTRGPNDLDETQAAAAVAAILANHTAVPNLVVSHADKDHFNYLDTILAAHQMDHIWLGGISNDYTGNGSDLADFNAVISAQDQNGATVHRDRPAHFDNNQTEMGASLSCGDASVFILTVNSGNTKNGRSLVMSIDYGDFAVIFTGDAEGPTEERAVDNYAGALKAAVLTGSHHGSHTKGSNDTRSTSDWVEATAPEVMVYNHGQTFGHPRCSITDNYHDDVATVPAHSMHCGRNNDDNTPRNLSTQRAEYSTEVSQAITITTDGTSPMELNCGSGEVGCSTEIAF